MIYRYKKHFVKTISSSTKLVDQYVDILLPFPFLLHNQHVNYVCNKCETYLDSKCFIRYVLLISHLRPKDFLFHILYFPCIIALYESDINIIGL